MNRTISPRSFFLILNTFSIIVAQRTRELALLRAMGASRRQVITSVLVEAVAIGLLAAGLGLAAGIGVGFGLAYLFANFAGEWSDRTQSYAATGGFRTAW